MICSKLRLLLVVVLCSTAIQIVSLRYRSSSPAAVPTTTKYRQPSATSAPTMEVRASTRMLTADEEPGSSPASNSSDQCGVRRGNTFSVNATGNFTERLQRFNDAIDCARSAVVSYLQNISSETKHLGSSAVLMNDDDYVQSLAKYRHISTVVLPWQQAAKDPEERAANLFSHRFYPWTGTPRLCDWMRHNTRLPKLYVRVFTEMACNEDLNRALRPVSTLNYGHFKVNTGKWPTKEFYRKRPSSVAVLHVLAGENFVTGIGQTISGKSRLVIDYCFRHHRPRTWSPKTILSAPHVDEVFSIQHPAGNAVYHSMAEELPRLAPFVDFLRRRPEVRIHASNKRRVRYFLRVLGLDPSRTISGPVRAGLVYVPRPPTCMFPRVVETQLMSHYCRKFARSKYGQRPRNRLILILRSGERRFYEQEAVTKTVKKAAAAHGLRYTEFTDDPTPSFGSTMSMFYEAAMVVAAHGAGLSNILFCRPRTFVVEIVPNSFVTPLCYLQLAYGLGHHWHGVGADGVGWGVSRVNVTTLQRVVHANLVLWKKQTKDGTSTR